MTLARVGGGTFKKPVLDSVADVTRLPVVRNRLLMGGLGISASLMFTVPIANNQLPEQLEGALLLCSSIQFACLGAVAYGSIEAEKLQANAVHAKRELFKGELQKDLELRLIQQDTSKKLNVLGFIEQLPEHLQFPLLQEFDLIPYIQQTPKQVQAEIVREPEPVKISAMKSAAEQQIEASVVADIIEPDWIDKETIMASKMIFAPKGSGKTCWLQFEATSFLMYNPNGILWICDPHYQKGTNKWLVGVPNQIVEDRFVTKKADQILKKFRQLREALRKRVENDEFDAPPIKLICDEYDSCVRKWSEQEALEVASIVQEIEDEGRKFHVNSTIVAHTAKKELIKIDSTAIIQMMMMAMGSALADPNTKLPADIDKTKLLEQQRIKDAQIPDLPGVTGENGKPVKMAKTCVIRKADELCAEVVYIPHPDILMDGLMLAVDESANTQVEIEVEDLWDEQPTAEDPMLALKQWFKSQKEEPTSIEIKKQFETLFRRQWVQSDEALNYLLNELRR